MLHSKFETSDLPYLPELQPADWGDLFPRFKYFLESEYCTPLKITIDGQLAAIGTTMLHRDTAWLACIITHADHRNKGLGTAMTVALIDSIDKERCPTIYLDATVYGFPVYKKLGFELEAEYSHLSRRELLTPTALPENVIPFQPSYRESLLLLDYQAYGEDRRGILGDFIEQSLLYVKEDEVLGYYIPGWGDFPIVASTLEAGQSLVSFRGQQIERAVLPSANVPAIDYLKLLGYEMYKVSRRMRLGPIRQWNPEHIYNRVSGQLG